jgi:ferritin-like protein
MSTTVETDFKSLVDVVINDIGSEVIATFFCLITAASAKAVSSGSAGEIFLGDARLALVSPIRRVSVLCASRRVPRVSFIDEAGMEVFFLGLIMH